MSLTKVSEWPRVLPNDDGIRPGGRPDECFYCHSKVGELHGEECVIVEKRVAYRVCHEKTGKYLGTFERPDPHFWTSYDCEFHKNGSSWCADNALDDIDWVDVKDGESLETEMRQEDRCSCSLLRFEYDRTVDEGPFITLKETDHD